MDRFMIKLSGIPIEIESRYEYCRMFCRDYLISDGEKPLFSVYAPSDKIERFREFTPDVRDEYLERDAIYSEISSNLPYHDRAALHGACISYKNKGYLFTAASGTGKSTHIGMWRTYIGEDVKIVNGDKPIFHISSEDGETKITAFDTPWCGKEGWRGEPSEISAICFLQRSENGSTASDNPTDGGRYGKNTIQKISPAEALPYIMRQMFHPYEPEATGRMLELLDVMLKAVPLYILKCDISEDAVRCSFETLTGEKYVRRDILSTPEEIYNDWRK